MEKGKKRWDKDEADDYSCCVMLAEEELDSRRVKLGRERGEEKIPGVESIYLGVGEFMDRLGFVG